MHIDLKYIMSSIINGVADVYYSFFTVDKFVTKGLKQILVVRIDAVGDFVLWLDAARALRKMYPPSEYRIVLAGNLQWVDLAKSTTYFDEIIPVDRNKLFWSLIYRCEIWRTIRKTVFHLVVNPTYSRDFNVDDSLVRISRACRRIGFIGDATNQPPWKKKISDRWYTELVAVPTDYPLMELERNSALIRYLGAGSFRAGIPKIVSPPRKREQHRLSIVIVPCASDRIKQWPVQKFVALVRMIQSSDPVDIYVCGAPGEEATGEVVSREAEKGKGEGRVELLAGKTSLLEYVDIISRADLVIGNDSSAIHIATAVGTPSVCIAGGGHFGRFVPYKLEGKADGPLPLVVVHPMDCFPCRYRDCCKIGEDGTASCLHAVQVSEVFAKVRPFLR